MTRKLHLSFNTGRDYGKPQVITCMVEFYSPDIDNICDMRIVFVDTVRNIAGAIVCHLFTDSTPREIQTAITTYYDIGKYEQLSIEEAYEFME